MKLLLDENLSRRFLNRLNLLFPGWTYVRDVGLIQADDMVIWHWAEANEFDMRGVTSRLARPAVVRRAMPSVVYQFQGRYGPKFRMADKLGVKDEKGIYLSRAVSMARWCRSCENGMFKLQHSQDA